MATLTATLLGLLLILLTSVAALATNLSTAAAAVPPGSFIELTGMLNWNNGAILAAAGCTNDRAPQWANTAVWNPVAKRFQFSGSSHAPCSSTNEKAVFYDDATNTWGALPTPTSRNDPRHSYGHNAMNPATGEHYYTTYDSRDNLRLTNGGSGWTALAQWPGSANPVCCRSQAWFPDRGTLVRWDGDWGLWEYNPSSNTWTQRARGVGNDGTSLPQFVGDDQPTISLYSARCHCIMFGNGSVWQKFNSDGTFTTLSRTNSPGNGVFNVGPSKSSWVVDPVTGLLIVISSGSSTMKQFDPGTTNGATGTWTNLGAIFPSFFASADSNSESLLSAPIPDYGVIMYLKDNEVGTARVFLYKHAASQPGQIPLPPSQVGVR